MSDAPGNTAPPTQAMTPLTLGTMNFGTRTPSDEAARIVDRARQEGIAWFDTANLYGNGESERLCGRLLRDAHARGEVCIATKVGLLRQRGRSEGLGAERIVAALDESLQRLRIGCVDLYYLHAPDPETPIDQTLDGLARLLDSGRIRAWGVSNFAAWQVLELIVRADARGLPRPRVSQVLYNLLVRQLDVEYLAFARAYGLHTTVYNPLAGGLLAREARPGDTPPKGSRFDTNPLYRGRYWSEAMIARAGRYRALALDVGLSPISLAYAWLAHRRATGVDSILVGPGTVGHLDAALEGVRVKLAPDVLARIEALHLEIAGTDARYAR